MIEQIIQQMITAELIHNPEFIRVPLEEYSKKIANRASIIIHFDNGIPLGMIAYYCNDLKSRSIYITSLVINDTVRRKGLGQMLTRAAMNHGKSLGFEQCRLEVASSNITAVRFYQKLGFDWTGDGERLMQCPI
jgi:ribosomal protein S18 acetylase RimI-like enzyme